MDVDVDVDANGLLCFASLCAVWCCRWLRFGGGSGELDNESRWSGRESLMTATIVARNKLAFGGFCHASSHARQSISKHLRIQWRVLQEQTPNGTSPTDPKPLDNTTRRILNPKTRQHHSHTYPPR